MIHTQSSLLNPFNYRSHTWYDFHIFMSGSLDNYINKYNPIYPEYIDLKLLKYLLSIGSTVCCEVYFDKLHANKFRHCMLQLGESHIKFSNICKVKRSSLFKVKQQYKIMGYAPLIKISYG